MRDKKKIVALVLFIVMGFLMFTFANPSDNIDSKSSQTDSNSKKTKTTDSSEEVTDNNQQNLTGNANILNVDNAPVINVNPKEVKIVRGTNYDVMTGVTVTDDKDNNLKPVASITSLENSEAGKYTITYTVTDSGNNTVQASRVLYILDPKADEDNDGYTNQEEIDSKTDFDNVSDYPTYDKAPTINVDDSNVYSMEFGKEIPTFKATATDKGDGDLAVVITNNIINNKLGTYTVTFTATDSLGNKTIVEKGFKVVDTQAPVFTNKFAMHSTGNITINATDNSGEIKTIEVTNQDTGKKFNINNGDELTEEATYSLYAYDASGNKSSQLWVAIDRTTPTINIQDGKIYNTDVDLVVFDKFLSKGSITINGVNHTSEVTNQAKNENGTYETLLTNDGTYKIVATDKVGNTITKTITIDKTAPIISDVQNSSNGNWTNKAVTVSWKINEKGSGLKTVQYCYSVNCTDWKNLDSKEYNGFSRSEERNNIVYIRAIDNAGNYSNIESLTFKIDKTKPTIVARSDQDILTSGSTFDLRKDVRVQPADNNARGKVFVNGKEYTQYYGSGSFGINWIIDNDKTTNVFNVVVYDAAGNQSDPFVINVDRTAPDGTITYSNNNGNAVTNSDVTVTLKTTEKILVPAGWTKVSDTEFTKVYSDNGKYSVDIEDLYGNTNTINYEVKRIDKVNPIIDGIENNGFYEHDLTYNIVKSKDNSADFSIIDDNFSTVIVDGISYDYKTSPNKITGEGTHTVRAIDKAGNSSETITFTIDYPFTITQKLSDDLIAQGYRFDGSSKSPVVNKYYSKTKFTSFACVNDGTTSACQPVVWKDSKGNIVSTIANASTVVSSSDMEYEASETFTAYQMGAVIEYRLSDEFINMGYKIGSSSTNSNQESFSTVRTYYFNEPTRMVSFPYVNSGAGTYMVYNSNGELVSTISDGMTKPLVYNHVVTGHEVYTIVPLMYNVTFKDHDGSIISSQKVMATRSYTAPDMTGKTYTSKDITYNFSGWDQTVAKVTSNLTINANYDVTSVKAVLYSLDKNAIRTLNGGSSNSSNYTKLGTINLNVTSDIKDTIKSGPVKVLTSDLSKVITYVSDQSLLPVPADKDENFTKYEYYVIKYESDGWHIDCQEVVDAQALNDYRNNALGIITSYATNIGFDVNSSEIQSVLSTANMNGLITKTSIDNAVNTAKTSIDGLFRSIKDAAKNAIQVEINNDSFKNNYLVQANAIKDKANLDIESATTISSVNLIRDNAITSIDNLKSLSLNTFDVSVVSGDWGNKHIAVNNIASDVIITKVSYVYQGIFDTYEIARYTNTVFASSVNVSEPLALAIKVRIEYIKNGISYFAKYDINRSWGVAYSVTKYADTYSA